MTELNADAPRDFSRTMVAQDVAAKKFAGEVKTRFPP